MLPLHRATSPAPSSAATSPRTFIQPRSPRIHPQSPPKRQTPNVQHFQRREPAQETTIADTQKRGFSTASGAGPSKSSLHHVRSPSGPFPIDPEPIYDPFTGQLTGYLGPPDAENRPVDTPQHGDDTNSDTSSKEDDGWRRQKERTEALAKIRLLQSEVARSHLAMEDIGGEAKSPALTSSVTRKPLSPRGSISKRSIRPESIKATAKDAWAQRREAIDEVARKVSNVLVLGYIENLTCNIQLDDLTLAIQEYHSIPDDQFDFPPMTSANTGMPIPRRRNSGSQRSASPFGSSSPYFSNPAFPNPSSRPGPSNSPPITPSSVYHPGFGIPPGFGVPPGPNSASSSRANLQRTGQSPRLPPIFDDAHRQEYDSPVSTQASFRMYSR